MASKKRRLSGPARLRLVRSLLKESTHCHWCPTALTEHNATLDHIIPKSAGGSNARSNQTLACAPCNSNRGDMEYEQFKKLKFPPSNALKISHQSLAQCGTSMDEIDLELAKLELGHRAAGAMLKENGKTLKERFRSGIRPRFTVMKKLGNPDMKPRLYTDMDSAEHCMYSYNREGMYTYRKRFTRTWGQTPFKDL